MIDFLKFKSTYIVKIILFFKIENLNVFFAKKLELHLFFMPFLSWFLFFQSHHYLKNQKQLIFN